MAVAPARDQPTDRSPLRLSPEHRRRSSRGGARLLGRHRRPHARDGRRAGHGSRRAGLVRRDLGDDDGGDDAAVGVADGLGVRAGEQGAGESWSRRVRADVGLRRRLPGGVDGTACLRTASSVSSRRRPAMRWHGTARDRTSPGERSSRRGSTVDAHQGRLPASLPDTPPLPLHGWHEGKVGALRMGVVHGLYCVGCCWGLMIVLFSLGVMSLVWMAMIAGVIFAEKVLPHGERVTRLVAVALVALGLWIAISPGSVPGLTDPAGPGNRPCMEPEQFSYKSFLWIRVSWPHSARWSSGRASPRRLSGWGDPAGGQPAGSLARGPAGAEAPRPLGSPGRADRGGAAALPARSVSSSKSDSCSRTSPAGPRGRCAGNSRLARLDRTGRHGRPGSPLRVRRGEPRGRGRPLDLGHSDDRRPRRPPRARARRRRRDPTQPLCRL